MEKIFIYGLTGKGSGEIDLIPEIGRALAVSEDLLRLTIVQEAQANGIIAMITYPFSLKRYDAVYDLFEIGQFALYNPRRPNHRPLELFVSPTLRELQKNIGITLIRAQSVAAVPVIDEDSDALNLSSLKITNKEKTTTRVEKDEPNPPKKGDHILITLSDYRRRAAIAHEANELSRLDKGEVRLASGRVRDSDIISNANTNHLCMRDPLQASPPIRRKTTRDEAKCTTLERPAGNGRMSDRRKAERAEHELTSDHPQQSLRPQYTMSTNSSARGYELVFGNNGPGSNKRLERNPTVRPVYPFRSKKKPGL